VTGINSGYGSRKLRAQRIRREGSENFERTDVVFDDTLERGDYGIIAVEVGGLFEILKNRAEFFGRESMSHCSPPEWMVRYLAGSPGL